MEELKGQFPFQQLLCRDDYTGVAFLSKHAWSENTIVDTGDVNLPLEFVFPRLGEQISGFRLLATHPLPPFGAKLTDSRDRQLNGLAGRCVAGFPALLVGDFNLTPWSPRFGRLLAIGNLRDASLGYEASPTLTPLPTFLGGLKVDHILVNCQVGILDFELKSSAHSDHRCVIVDFCVEGDVP